MKLSRIMSIGCLMLAVVTGCAPDDGKTPTAPDGGAESAAPFSRERVSLPGAPYAAAPEKAELLDESGALALFAGLTAEDVAYNKDKRLHDSETPCRNSLFLRRRAADGTDEW